MLVPQFGPASDAYDVAQQFSSLDKQSSDNQDPLYRLFHRESNIGKKLLDQVKKDLADVIKVCQGDLKQTNHLRTLMSSLTKGACPCHPLSRSPLTVRAQAQSRTTGGGTRCIRRWACRSGCPTLRGGWGS